MPWIKEGHLPNLKKILDGSSGVLRSTLEPITPCAWASMVTGKNPGKTGVFDFAQIVRGSYDLRFPNRTHVSGSSIWDQAEKHNLKCGIVNVPMGYPACKLKNGIYIAGMGSPSPDDNNVFWPKELRFEVEKNLNRPYEMMEFSKGRKTKDGYSVLRENLISYTEFQKELSMYLLEKKDLDLFFIVFPATDQVGHYFWKHWDKKHPLYSEKLNKDHGNVLLEVYKSVDLAIGEIMDSFCGKKTHTWVLSDHGMGPFHRAPDFVSFLESEGYLKLKVPIQDSKKMIAFVPLLGKISEIKFRFFSFLKKYLPLNIKNFFNSLFKVQKESYVESMSMLSVYDWKNTKVFVTDPKNMGEIHINLKEREPQGIVLKKDYEKLREDLIDLFESICLKDGTKLVLKAHKKEDIYDGPYLHDAPDIVIEWNLNKTGYLDPQDKDVPKRYKSLFNRFDLTPSWTDVVLPYNGFHRMEGIWAVKGPGIKFSEDVKANIWDPYLEIMSSLGVPVPDDIDSEKMDIWKKGKRPKIIQEKDSSKDSSKDYSKEDEDAVKKRLKEMGYLG